LWSFEPPHYLLHCLSRASVCYGDQGHFFQCRRTAIVKDKNTSTRQRRDIAPKDNMLGISERKRFYEFEVAAAVVLERSRISTFIPQKFDWL
jgi:hypothetical protein